MISYIHSLFVKSSTEKQHHDVFHDILYVEGCINSRRHFIGVFDAHAEKILHLLKLRLFKFINVFVLRFVCWLNLVNKLNDSTRNVGIVCTEYWTNHEVFNIGLYTLIINFFDEFGFFARIVRNIKLLRFENMA